MANADTLQWGTFAGWPWRCLAAGGDLSGRFIGWTTVLPLLGWLSGAFHRSARGFALLRVVSSKGGTCGPATVLPAEEAKQRGKSLLDRL